MIPPAKLKRLAVGAAVYGGITVVTLVVLDLVLIWLGLFPPRVDQGDPELGWTSSRPTGRMETVRCVEFSTGDTLRFVKNEVGIRTHVTAADLERKGEELRIAVTGDSQTELCAPNEDTHPGVLEAELMKAGVDAIVLPYGVGKYSPLQDYLAFKVKLAPYDPGVLVLNVYTGNDFYDILRVDDRPHLVRTDTGYAVAPPVWYQYDEPGHGRRSRVLHAVRTVGDRLGVRGILQRLRILRAAAAEQGEGVSTVLRYVRDLRRSTDPSLGYSAALTAQMLNQQIFLYRFPRARDEAIARMRAVLELARREFPDLVVVLSPIPSYQLVQEQPVDTVLLRTIARLPITYDEGVRQERSLYDMLATLAGETGWLFVDNLSALRAYEGPERLYNDFDYHLLPVASAIVGRAQAAVLLRHFATHR